MNSLVASHADSDTVERLNAPERGTETFIDNSDEADRETLDSQRLPQPGPPGRWYRNVLRNNTHAADISPDDKLARKAAEVGSKVPLQPGQVNSHATATVSNQAPGQAFGASSRPQNLRSSTYDSSSSSLNDARQYTSHDVLPAEYHYKQPLLVTEQSWPRMTKEDLYQEMEQIYVENAQLRRDNDILKQLSDSAAMELNSLKSEKNFNRDDEFFKSRLFALRYKIKNWAVTHFSGDLTQHTLPSSMTSTGLGKEILLRMTFDEEYARCSFKSPTHRPWLVEAYIWSVSLTKIFSDQSSIWAGRLRKPVVELQRYLNPSGYNNTTEFDLRYYHSWRAATTGLVQERVQNDTDQAALVSGIAKECKWLGRYSSNSWVPAETELKEIFSYAVEFDAEMKKQRAYYYLCSRATTRHNVTFDPGSMETVDGRQSVPNAVVAFMIRPWLCKKGLSSGEGYIREQLVLAKAAVMIYSDMTQQDHSMQRSQSNQPNRSLMDPPAPNHKQTINTQVSSPATTAQHGEESPRRTRRDMTGRSGRERSSSAVGHSRQSIDGRRPAVHDQGSFDANMAPAVPRKLQAGQPVIPRRKR